MAEQARENTPRTPLWVVPVTLPDRYFGTELAVRAASADGAKRQATLVVSTLAGYTGSAR